MLIYNYNLQNLLSETEAKSTELEKEALSLKAIGKNFMVNIRDYNVLRELAKQGYSCYQIPPCNGYYEWYILSMSPRNCSAYTFNEYNEPVIEYNKNAFTLYEQCKRNIKDYPDYNEISVKELCKRYNILIK